MAEFNYVAVNKQGKREKGIIEAVDEQDLKKKLRLKGLILVNSIKSTKSQRKSKGFKFQSSVNSYDLTLITRQMATMLESGIALLIALPNSFRLASVGSFITTSLLLRMISNEVISCRGIDIFCKS